MLWKVRESGLGATAHVPNKPITWEGWEDSAVPPEKLGRVPARAARAVREVWLRLRPVRPFRPGLRAYAGSTSIWRPQPASRNSAHSCDERRIWSCSLGGSLSGEHGDGQSQGGAAAEHVRRRLDRRPSVSSRRSGIRTGKMNPGQVIDAYRPTRTCAWAPTTIRRSCRAHFHYPGRQGQLLAHAAALRRRRRMPQEAAARCARAIMATREEMHSTRGRAHLLFEMLQGEVDHGRLEERGGERGARPVPVLQGLQGRMPGQRRHGDLQGRVPVALLRRPPPPAARLCVRADRPLGAPGVACCPGVANFFIRKEPFASMAKTLGCISRRSGASRRSPRRHSPPGSGSARPTSQRAASDLCGRTPSTITSIPRWPRRRWKCWNMPASRSMSRRAICAADGRSTNSACSTAARQYLPQRMDELADDIRAGTPIVGLEPACVVGVPRRTYRTCSRKRTGMRLQRPGTTAQRIP